MKLLSLSLTSPEHDPAANVALDEALLESAEAGNHADETLRLWLPDSPVVVIGRSSKIREEVNLEFCSENGVPVFRRSSGGASIVTAPGCLMYAVLLSYQKRPQLRMLDQAHEFVMRQMQEALRFIGVDSEFQGTCDLTIDDRKISGNALRCKKQWMIYHGTMICQSMDTSLISNCLRSPQRQPEYRGGRSHEDFVARIPVSTTQLAGSIAETWDATETLDAWPAELTRQLVKTKYTTQAWNYKL